MYCCGDDIDGILGLSIYRNESSLVEENELQILPTIPNNTIQVSTGKYHSLFLDSTGKVYSCGDDRFAGTGLNTIGSVIAVLPTRITGGDISDKIITQVSAIDKHSLFLDSTGKVYSCGSNSRGMTGLNITFGETLVPTEITFGDTVGKTIIQVSAGEKHSLFLDSTGKVYSCGDNGNGRTGLNTTMGETAVPTRITVGISFKTIIQVSSALNHSLFLDSTGKVYSCGDSGSGATGLNTSSDIDVPTRITANISDKIITQVSAGANHSLFLDSTGKVYSCGDNADGALGLNTISDTIEIPTEITFGDIVGKTIIQVSAGRDHSLFLDSTGKVYSCGLNANKRTGLNTSVGNNIAPTLIFAFNKTIIHIIAGAFTSFFIAKLR